MPFLNIDICNEFLNDSSEKDLGTEQFALCTSEESTLLNEVLPQYKMPKRLNDLFSNDRTADTVSISDDNSMDMLNTHDSDDDSLIDTHECNGIYNKDDLEELIYEIPVPKTGNPRNKSLMLISICVIDTI